MLPSFLIRPPAGFAVITTTGRKTGKPRRKCIRAIRKDGKVYVVQLRPPELAIARPSVVAAWVWNIRSNPNVTLRIRGGTHAGVAREIKDPVELADARDAFCDTVKLFDYGECATHMRGLPSRSKIEDMHRYWFDTGIPIAIEFAEQEAGGSIRAVTML